MILMNHIIKVYYKTSGIVSRYQSDHRWLEQLREFEKKAEYPVCQLTRAQEKEINEYYAQFGFRSIKTDWHRYIYSVTGRFSPMMLPEDFFHRVVERSYNDQSVAYAWEDKALMPFLLDSVRFPETICCNINGYYYDKNMKMISVSDARKLVSECEYGFAKPIISAGGGKGTMLVDCDHADDVFDKHNKNFIVQKRIIQSSETAHFNPTSVNTEKVVSFLYKGEVFILSSILRIGAPDAITDAASDGRGFFYSIKDDGSLSDFGMNIYGKKKSEDFFGNQTKGRKLSHHKEILDIIKKAHKRFPYFGFMSWDFCVNDQDEVILIEYNTGYPEALVYQMVTGPFLGELTDEVLSDLSDKLNLRS